MQVYVFGDSITQGFHDLASGGWCNRIAIELMRREVETNYDEDHAVFNLGISGDTSDGVVGRIEPELAARGSSRERLLLVAIGINDACYNETSGACRVPLPRHRENLEHISAVGQAQCDHVAFVSLLPIVESLLTPIPWAGNLSLTDALRAQYDAVLREVASAHGHTLIDVADVFPADTAFLPDGIHPNAAGHERISRRVLEFLEAAELLK